MVSHAVDMEHIQVYSSSWQSLGVSCWVCAIIECNELASWHVTIPISHALGLPFLLISVVIQCVSFNLGNLDVLLYQTGKYLQITSWLERTTHVCSRIIYIYIMQLICILWFAAVGCCGDWCSRLTTWLLYFDPVCWNLILSYGWSVHFA